MRIRTDDEVYRVDAVWLGPPRATFPWRARYASYAVGLVVMVVVMFLQRRLGISLGFFSVAWALLVTVGITRFVGRRIDEDRPLVEWLTLFAHEVRGPRRRVASTARVLDARAVRVRGLPAARPAPDGPREADEPRPSDEAGRSDEAGFGPPSSITVGDPVPREAAPPPRALGGATPHRAADDVAAWTRPAAARPRRSRAAAPSAVRVRSERVVPERATPADHGGAGRG